MIDTTNRDDLVFPSSPGQRRLWFMHRMTPESARAYSMAARVDLAGAVDASVLQRALNAVVEKHEALRTGLRLDGDQLVQVVHQGAVVPLQRVDLTGRDARSREDGLQRIINHATRRRWDLAAPPLLRATLVMLDPHHSVLVLCVHHAVCDGISLQVVANELFAGYQRAAAGVAPTLVGDPLQFADFVMWSAGGEDPDDRWVSEHQTQLDYWTRKLAALPPGVDLPADRHRPARQSFDGSREPLIIEQRLADQLRAWAARHRVSLSSALLTAFVVVLHRSSGSEDIAVGIPVANRCRAELSDTVGFVANTCVLRAELGGETLAELAQRVHADVGDLIRHSDLPFGDLVEAINPPRMLDRNPMFSVLFGFQPDVQRSWDLPGVHAEVSDVDTRTARLDLSLFLFEQPAGEVRGFLEYATALFDRETASRIVEQMKGVLGQLLTGPDQHVAVASLDSRASRWPEPNGEEVATPALWAEIQRHVRQRPMAIALNDEETALSYRELGERVAAAAGRLRRAGVRQGQPVAVHVERGVAAAVAMLACWRAGAVYVPIDPASPPERRRLIAERIRPVAAVCTDVQDLAEVDLGVRVSAEDLMSAPLVPMAPVPHTSESLAYVMFTSGSTGLPKGIGVTHGNLAYFVTTIGDQLGFTRSDRLLALTTTAFDISLLELLCPLLAGGGVDIAPRPALRDGAALRRRLEDPTNTIAQATPSTWRLALDAGWCPRPGLKVLCGGEALPPDLADALLDGSDTVWNLYGPTETTVWSCAARVEAGTPVVLGAPIKGTTTVVVDQDLNPVPTGVCGELLICGPGVAAGYLSAPGTTAARFLPDPARSGRRLYRTGDLVRRRSNGALEFVGRVDDQIKIRGHRIEIGEVEAALRSAPGVRDGAVAVAGAGTSARLAAYLVPATHTEVRPSWAAEVRRHCSTVLSAATVPAEYHQIDAIPLNANGKVQRRALPDRGRRLELVVEHVAPRDETERAVAALWGELLGVERVGATDDFFALGGHSLLASRMMQRIEAEFGVSVPVAEIFMEPTIARIARTIADLRGATGDIGPGPSFQATDSDWDFGTVARVQTSPEQTLVPAQTEVSSK